MSKPRFLSVPLKQSLKDNSVLQQALLAAQLNEQYKKAVQQDLARRRAMAHRIQTSH